MTIREQQSLFIKLLARLIDYAYTNGWEMTGGELYRTPEQAALNAKNGSGIAHSLHCDRLAVDLQLFRDGTYLADSEDYRALGEFWERLNPLCRWGGRIKPPRVDGNHFSLSPDNRI